MKRAPRAYGRCGSRRLARRVAADDDDVVVGENAELDRLTGGFGLRGELVGRRDAQVEIGPHAVCQLEQAQAQAVAAVLRLEAHEPLAHQRREDPVKRCLGETARVQEVGESRGMRGPGHEVDRRHGLFDGRDARAVVGLRRYGRAGGLGGEHPLTSIVPDNGTTGRPPSSTVDPDETPRISCE